MKFKIKFEPYKREISIEDIAVITQGKVKIWFGEKLVRDEEDYISSFLRGLLVVIEKIKDGKPGYADHYDSSGFIGVIKEGAQVEIQLGRGDTHSDPPNIQIQSSEIFEWEQFLESVLDATGKLLIWISKNYVNFQKDLDYQLIQSTNQKIIARFYPKILENAEELEKMGRIFNNLPEKYQNPDDLGAVFAGIEDILALANWLRITLKNSRFDDDSVVIEKLWDLKFRFEHTKEHMEQAVESLDKICFTSEEELKNEK